MITGLPNPKATYLLGAGLDVLHHESQEWLATIEFWKYELRFFAEILYWKEPVKENQELFEQLFNKFEALHQKVDSDLERAVMDHEKYLTDLMRNEKGSNWEYRAKHKEISVLMNNVTKEYKQFKKDVFEYVKHF